MLRSSFVDRDFSAFAFFVVDSAQLLASRIYRIFGVGEPHLPSDLERAENILRDLRSNSDGIFPSYC